MGDDNPEKL